jgi:hypothetical protein
MPSVGQQRPEARTPGEQDLGARRAVTVQVRQELEQLQRGGLQFVGVLDHADETLSMVTSVGQQPEDALQIVVGAARV